jgi:hypothetical protein
VPLAVVVAAEITGFCRADTKALGPDHEYDNAPVPPLAETLNERLLPAHTGPLLPMALIAGDANTEIVCVAVLLQPAALVPVTV